MDSDMVLAHTWRNAMKLWSSKKRAVHTVASPQPFAPTTFNPKLRWWTDEEWLERNDRYLLPDNHVGLHHHRILDRRFTLNSLARSVRHLSGSTAECGVFKGVSSAMICTALDGSYSQGAKHYGFDSFEGLPAPGSNDASWQRGQLATPLEATKSHLSDFKYCQLIVGWIPDTFTNVESEVFRLVHIDLDLEKPTTDALNFFYPRSVAGALFIFDDYGFHSCPGVRSAVDRFLEDKPETLVELTTGQAFFYRTSDTLNVGR
jgi:O-methyltransferase